MERINLSKAVTDDSFIGHLLIHAMTQVAGLDLDKVFGMCIVSHSDKTPGVEVDVDIRINGVTIPLNAFVSAWNMSRDRYMLKNIRELVKRRMARVFSRLSTVERALDAVIADEFPDEVAKEW